MNHDYAWMSRTGMIGLTTLDHQLAVQCLWDVMSTSMTTNGAGAADSPESVAALTDDGEAQSNQSEQP